MVWSIQQLEKWDTLTKTKNNGWVKAKPLNSTKICLSIKERIKRAWKVFQCKYDVFLWPEDS